MEKDNKIAMLEQKLASEQSIREQITTTLCCMSDILAIAKNRNEALINNLKEIKQQLIDGGKKNDSVTIMSIDAAIEENSI